MSRATNKSTFYNCQCLNMLCNEEGPHYHNKNSLNKFNVGPLRTNSSNTNSRRNNKTRKAILDP